MPKEFNFIYEKLVSDRNDIIGHIAYSIYKQDKIDYLKSKTDQEIIINSETLKSFNEISSSKSAIESYKIKAELVMQAFFENTFDEMSNDIEKQVTENHAQILKDTVKPLTSGFWKNVWAGLISAFIFTLILAAIAFIIQFQGSTINIEIKKQQNNSELSK